MRGEQPHPSARAAAPSPVAFAIHASANFVFRYTPLDAATIAATAAAVEAEHARVVDDLGVAPMPPVTVTLYPDVDAFRAGVTPLVGPVPRVRVRPGSGIGRDPRAVARASPRRGATPGGITAIVHEFAHCASVARESVHRQQSALAVGDGGAVRGGTRWVDPRTLPYLTGRRPPALADLDPERSSTAIYEVGGLIGEYVVEPGAAPRCGTSCGQNGALQGVLGVDEAGFVSAWFAYVSEQARAVLTTQRPFQPGGGRAVSVDAASIRKKW